RAQAYQFLSTQTLYAAGITSHAIGGSLAIEQSPTYSTTPSSSAVIQIGPATSGIKFSCYLNRDSQRRTFPGNAPGSRFVEYSLSDIGNALGTGRSEERRVGKECRSRW